MTFSVRDSSGLATIGAVSVRDSAGLSAIATISLRDGNGLSTVFSSGGAGGNNALTPDEVDGYGYDKGNITVSTSAATINNFPSGATVTWNFDPAFGWSAVTPNSASTPFRKTNVAQGNLESTQVTATVTSSGKTYTTNAITATVQNTYGGGN